MTISERRATLVRFYVLLVVGLTMIASSCDIILDRFKTAPTDHEMRSVFANNRTEFETLVRMSNEDEKLIRITYDFTWDSVTGSSKDTGEVGLSSERWAEYKRLFNKLNLDGGIARGHDGSVWFFYYTSGLGVSGLIKGFAFTKNPLICGTESLDRIEQVDKRECVQLEKDWYLYLTP